MNSKLHLLSGTWLLVAASATHLFPARAAEIQTAAQVLDAGGGLSTSGGIQNLGSLGGISAAPLRSEGGTGGFSLHPGFPGQITEVLQVDLAASPGLLAPGEGALMSGTILLDDFTTLLVTGSDIVWTAPSFPLVAITSDGWVTASEFGSLIQSNRMASVSGAYLGVVGTGQMLVLPSAKPIVIRPPASVTVDPGSIVQLDVVAGGRPPLQYQWFLQDVILRSATNASLALSGVTTNDAAIYTVQISNAEGITIASARVDVRGGPALVVQERPESRVAITSTNVILSVRMEGAGPFTYQWRLNGESLTNRSSVTDSGQGTARGILSGANESVLRIDGVQWADAGIYSLVVEQDGLTTVVEPIELHFPGIPELGPEIATARGIAQASGPRSVTFRPGVEGVATVTTAGSGFDSLLSVTEGSEIPTEVARDDDSGGFRTSLVRFTVKRELDYTLAVEGFAGSTGPLLLQWSVDINQPPLPRILTEPADQWVLLRDGEIPATRVVFSSTVEGLDGTFWRWLHNGSRVVAEGILSGNRDLELPVTVTSTNGLGTYQLQLGSNPDTSVFSRVAQLEAGTQTNLVSGLGDKGLYDEQGAIIPERVIALRLADTFLPPPPAEPASIRARARGGSVTQGIISGTQLTDTGNGFGLFQSKYFGFTLDTPATVTFDDRGSEVPTRITVGTGPTYGDFVPLEVANSGGNGQPINVRFDAQAGVQYWVDILQNGAGTGSIQLNWKADLRGEHAAAPLASDGRGADSAVLFHAKNAIANVIGVYAKAVQAPADTRVSLFQAVPFTTSRDNSRTSFPMRPLHEYLVVVEQMPDLPVPPSLVWDPVVVGGEPPTPGIAASSPDSVTLSWLGANWQLESADRLEPAFHGTPIPPTNNTVVIPVDGTSRYFRLIEAGDW